MDRRQMVLYSLSVGALAILPGCVLPGYKPLMKVAGKPVMPPPGYLGMVAREAAEKIIEKERAK